MESRLTVDYDQSVSAYRESLTTVLRGFRPPTELLETWVPDEDDAKSILNMLEAAEGAGLAGISIYISPSTLRRLDLVSLQEVAGQRGKVQTETSGEGLHLHISFVDSGTEALLSQTDKETDANHKAERAVRKENGFPAPRRTSSLHAAPWSGIGAVHPFYRERLRTELQRCVQEGDLKPEGGLELLQVSRQDTTLMALVEPRQHVIQRAAFRGTQSEGERAVLSLLCKYMEGRPVLECADHAMIYVERALRDPSQPAPVLGIITPENADAIFSTPIFLVRELLACYRRRTGFRDSANFYDLPPEADWLALTENEKVEKLQEAIARHPQGGGIEVVQIEGSKRVSVRLQDAGAPGPRSNRLIQIEAFVHAEVEPTLEIETEPRADANKLRRIKETNGS